MDLDIPATPILPPTKRDVLLVSLFFLSLLAGAALFVVLGGIQ